MQDVRSEKWKPAYQISVNANKKFEMPVDTRKFEAEGKKSKAKRIALFAFFGAFIGAINGLFGAGGGMLAVPVLSFAGKLDGRRSHATAILVMWPLCLASTVVYALSNTVDFAVLISTLIGVFVGGIIGAKLLGLLNENLLFFVFYALMLLAGFKMLY